jgi:hypothetical protein
MRTKSTPNFALKGDDDMGNSVKEFSPLTVFQLPYLKLTKYSLR